MTSYRDLVDTFGETNVVTLNYEDLREAGLPPGSARVLADVGLPQDVPTLFTTQVEGEPVVFSSHEFGLGDEDVKILVLGGPPGDAELRYFLDVYDSVVGIFRYSPETPQVDVINSTVQDFVAFLHLFGKYGQRIGAADPATREDLVSDLSTLLRQRDSFAFDDPDSWWSVVLQQLRSQGETPS